MILGVHHASLATRVLDGLLDSHVWLVGLPQVVGGNWQDNAVTDNIAGLENRKGQMQLKEFRFVESASD